MLSLLYGLAALLALSVAQLPPLWLAVSFFFLLMGCLGVGNGAVFQLVPQRYGKRVGIATGILGAAGGLGGFILPTVVGSLKQLTGTYAIGLAVLAGLATIALAALAVAQTEWIGVWIGQHGRAKGEPSPATPSREVLPDYQIASGTQG
jgi:NNP family nitrate/nitrite transporter-like MFS transporter